MGEYANIVSGPSIGQNIKIGTCEDCYYLRDDQRSLVDYEFDTETLQVFRFRFPWPDEDMVGPGSFNDYDRGMRIDGVAQPEHEHGGVQFSAPNGYLMYVGCPEGPKAPEGVQLNGYGGSWSLVQQGWREGRLVGIGRCNGCGGRFRIDDGLEQEVAVSIRSEADRVLSIGRPDCREGDQQNADRQHLIADRLLAGYTPTGR